jgi:hypothetical protein
MDRERKEWVMECRSEARGLAGAGRDQPAMVADKMGIGRGLPNGYGDAGLGGVATKKTSERVLRLMFQKVQGRACKNATMSLKSGRRKY